VNACTCSRVACDVYASRHAEIRCSFAVRRLSIRWYIVESDTLANFELCVDKTLITRTREHEVPDMNEELRAIPVADYNDIHAVN